MQSITPSSYVIRRYHFSLKQIINSLAPFALNAFPEAYLQFKTCILTLLYDKMDRSSPVSNEWY